MATCRPTLNFASLPLAIALTLSSAAFAGSMSFTLIDYPGSTNTAAPGINLSGQIVGLYQDGSGIHGYLLSGGIFSPINYPGSTVTEALGINDAGQIVGQYQTAAGTNWHGFLLSSAIFTPLDSPGATSTGAYGINSSGQIVGYASYGQAEAFLLSNGSYSNAAYPGATNSVLYSINNSGLAAGFYSNGSSGSGYLFDGSNFTSFQYPGAYLTEGYGINNSNVVTGFYCNPDCANVHIHGFVMSNGQFSSFDYPGSIGTDGGGINDNGAMVGTWSDFNLTYHGFLAMPTPNGGPPAAPAMLLCEPVRTGPFPCAIGGVTGNIGGEGSLQYYSFDWPGGAFGATASITGPTNTGASYLFSEGLAGSCSSGGQATLDSSNNFNGSISIPNLAAGRYCIGFDANSPNDPSYTIAFSTPVSGQPTPEPSSLALFICGLPGIAFMAKQRLVRRGNDLVHHKAVVALANLDQGGWPTPSAYCCE